MRWSRRSKTPTRRRTTASKTPATWPAEKKDKSDGRSIFKQWLDLDGGAAQPQERFEGRGVLQHRLGEGLQQNLRRRHTDPSQIPATVPDPRWPGLQPAGH